MLVLFLSSLVKSEFVANMRFPFIGSQDISLLITSKDTATIKLEGIINISDDIKYDVDSDNNINFVLGNEIQQILNKYYISLYDASYDSYDTAKIKIKIKPLNYKKTISLRRKKSQQEVNEIQELTKKVKSKLLLLNNWVCSKD